ncbi:MAG: 30S ribosomal protein S12 methylthiotransferase RimO [Planctomycetes bacterium]|nr:30S ribosomal protein S12 methylthiotransferase RimO [Planctomycetota bacterium]
MLLGSPADRERLSGAHGAQLSSPMPPTRTKPSAVVSLVHLGCARNLIDSELILGRLADQGLVVSGDPAAADTIVLNTCSFIGPAREESERNIKELVKRKKRGEIERVVVAGCLVQRFQHQLEKRFPGVDLFAEISDGAELAKAIKALSLGESVPRYLSNGGLREPSRDASRLLSTPKSFAYLRISHGCDHTCSFCAIPAIRGKHRSKRPDDVLSEARELIDAGVKELVIVAEDSTAWGRDMGLELPDLVEPLADLPGDHKIRVMYAYPNRFPWKLTRLLREHPRVAPYLDIPVQHIATPVLRAMRRAGSGDQVRATLDRLREEVPNITLRTTLLVGFPGETDADAAELVEFVKQYKIGRLGAFTYSPEEGTSGFELENDVPAKVARARHKAVLAARDSVLRDSQGALVGETLEVLIDEAASKAHPIALGRTLMDAPEVDLIVRVEKCKAAVGARVKAEILGLDEESNLVARVVK